MTRIFYALAALLCLSSCATIARRDYDITLASDVEGARARVYGEEKELPATFNVGYSRDTLQIVLVVDSVEKEYSVKPRLRPRTYAGNLFWNIYYPLALYIDRKNESGYYYGSYLKLDPNQDKPIKKGWWQRPVKAFADTHKGTVNVTVSLPHVNFFYLNPQHSDVLKSAGFWGISAGVEYYYKDSSYFKLGLMAATDLFVPIPAPITQDGVTERFGTTGGSITHNHVLNLFTVGYGLTYAKNTWRYENDGSDDAEPLVVGSFLHQKRATSSFGLQLNTYFRMSKFFHMGVMYNPYLYDIQPSGKFNYQHTISIDFLWKINLSAGRD